MPKVIQFYNGFANKFIDDNTKRYHLPKDMVKEIIFFYGKGPRGKLDLLDPSTRTYVQAALSVNAVSYHSGRQ